jgi:hypothetical protein
MPQVNTKIVIILKSIFLELIQNMADVQRYMGLLVSNTLLSVLDFLNCKA